MDLNAEWFVEMGLMDQDHAFAQAYLMNSLDHAQLDDQFNIHTLNPSDQCQSYSQINPKAATYHHHYHNNNNTLISASSSINEITHCLTLVDQDARRPEKQQKIYGRNSHMEASANSSLTSPKIISFENFHTTTVKPKTEVVVGSDGICINFPTDVIDAYSNSDHCQTSKQYCQGFHNRSLVMSRTNLHAQDHVIAERKRRGKLNQRFIALSALLPGLKKMDKASVLGDAVKYVKQLQEHQKVLEEQAANKTAESVIYLKRTHLSNDLDDHHDMTTCSSGEDSSSLSDQSPLPQIDARVSDKDVLVRIHCEKHKGCLANILNEMEKLQLTIINSTVLPFGCSTLDITVVAKMEAEFCLTPKDLVKKLRNALKLSNS